MIFHNQQLLFSFCCFWIYQYSFICIFGIFDTLSVLRHSRFLRHLQLIKVLLEILTYASSNWHCVFTFILDPASSSPLFSQVSFSDSSHPRNNSFKRLPPQLCFIPAYNYLQQIQLQEIATLAIVLSFDLFPPSAQQLSQFQLYFPLASRDCHLSYASSSTCPLQVRLVRLFNKTAVEIAIFLLSQYNFKNSLLLCCFRQIKREGDGVQKSSTIFTIQHSTKGYCQLMQIIDYNLLG